MDADGGQAMLLKKKAELRRKLGDYEERLSATPDVERQYLELVRDYDNSSLKFRELKAKELEANIAEELEKKSKGERFSIIEPPMLPERPIKPNRPAIAVLGLILSLGLAAGYVFMVESFDKSIRGSKRVAAICGHSPLVSVPLLLPEPSERELHLRRMLLLAGVVVSVVLALLAINVLMGPLDVLWFRSLRKLGLNQ